MLLDVKPAAATISVAIVKMIITPKLIMGNVFVNYSSKNPIQMVSVNLAMLLGVPHASQETIITVGSASIPMPLFRVENVFVL